MSKVPVNYKRTDMQSDQEVKWCPGCGDYTILASVQSFMAELGISKEKMVFVSGIGCAARFPYYMNTYGLHTIHGRAPAVATGHQDLTLRSMILLALFVVAVSLQPGFEGQGG